MKIRSLFAALPILAALAAPGCGEPHTVRSAEGKALTLSKPADQTIKQGETNKIDIAIVRKNFSDKVKIDFANLPSGIRIAEKEHIPAGDSSRTFTLIAKDDATPAEKRVVTVEAGGGGIVVNQTFELTVRAKAP